MRSAGFSVHIFMPSGDPGGIRIISKSHWTGIGFVIPRPLLLEAQNSQNDPELQYLQYPGVYILWGPSDTSQLPKIYVGEGDEVIVRLKEHAREKDFWTHAIIFTSKDCSLNKAHVQYLEAKLYELATTAKRAELDNSNKPLPPTLSTPDKADAEAFLRDILLCLPLLGVTAFEVATFSTPQRGEDLEPAAGGEIELHLEGKDIEAWGVDARGVDSSKGFIVRAGSKAVKDEVPSIPEHVKTLRRELIELGVLKEENGVYVLTQDYSFNSPSTAAGVLLGNSINGRMVWKDARGRTLRDIQAEWMTKHTHQPDQPSPEVRVIGLENDEDA